MKALIPLLIISFLITACAGIETRRGQSPQQDTQEESKDQVFEDEKMEEAKVPQRTKPRIALVLGPGAFKTFAYPSFLKALAQSGVNVDEVVGIEWGALSAAFFASNGKPHEAEWKLFKLKKEDVLSSSLFGSDKKQEVSKFRDYLRTNLGKTLLAKTTVPFQCPVLRMKRGSVDWGKQGFLWRRVEACLASSPQYQPVDNSVPSLFAVDQVAKNLKKRGYGIVILVNVLGDRKDNAWQSFDWVTQAYWAEARRHLWKAKLEFTDSFEINTSKYGPFDFDAKNGLKAVGERAGKEAAKYLVNKYRL